MARHGEILDGFRKVADHFDEKNPEHIVRLKMMLIKACDISNEVRPMDVSGPWVECLLEEYFQQVSLINWIDPHMTWYNVMSHRVNLLHLKELLYSHFGTFVFKFVGREREERRITRCTFHGQRQSNESLCSDWIYPVRALSTFRIPHYCNYWKWSAIKLRDSISIDYWILCLQLYPQLQALMVTPLKEAQEYYTQLQRQDSVSQEE